MDQVTTFLKRHTIHCAALHAKISRKQCAENIVDEFGPCANCPERKLAEFSGEEKPKRKSLNFSTPRRGRKRS